MTPPRAVAERVKREIESFKTGDGPFAFYAEGLTFRASDVLALADAVLAGEGQMSEDKERLDWIVKNHPEVAMEYPYDAGLPWWRVTLPDGAQQENDDLRAALDAAREETKRASGEPLVKAEPCVDGETPSRPTPPDPRAERDAGMLDALERVRRNIDPTNDYDNANNQANLPWLLRDIHTTRLYATPQPEER